MLLRQVQARPLQGHRLRALRRGGHAVEGAPRAHGPRRPRRPGQPHLVLQGRARAASATCSTWLPRNSRRSSTSPPRSSRGSTTRRARRTSTRSRRRSTRSSTPTPPSARSGCSSCASRSSAAREVPADGKQTNFNDEDHLWADSLDINLVEDLRGGAREAAQGAAQDLRGRHRRHRGLHRGRRRAHAQGVGAVQDDGAQADRARRDDLPRAEGALRLPVRLRRVLPRRHGRRGDPRPAPAGRPARPNASSSRTRSRPARARSRPARSSA